MLDLSIVIVNWNTRDLLLQCLDSIDEEVRARRDGGRIETETIVVDNGSRDGSVDAVRARFPWVRTLELPRNLGFASGCNVGLATIGGRHVLLLNSDTCVLRDSLEHCVRFLDAHPEVGIVGPQLLHPNGSRQNSFHNVPALATELVPKGVFQYLFRRRFPSRRWAGQEPIRVEAVAGAALFARGDLIKDLGPLPEDYFFFLEETDWCCSARRRGWQIAHVPRARVLHVSGASSKRKNPALTRIEYHRSLYRFYRKFRGRASARVLLAVKFAKSLLYVLSQAPLAAVGARHRARWKIHRDVLVWHLRGCPSSVGLHRMTASGLVDAASEPSAGSLRRGREWGSSFDA